MNINLLITDNNLPAVMEISSVPSKPDANNKTAKFSLPSDDKHSQVNNLEKPTADNVSKEIQNRQETVNESPQKLTQSIPQNTKSENPFKIENKTKPKEQISNTGTNKQPSKQNLIQSWLTENSVTIEHNNSVAVVHSNLVAVKLGKEEAAPKIESKAGKQPAQNITKTPAVKPSPVTGHAVKSAEIKLLHTTDKGQLGIKTVLPEKSNGENGLKAVLPETPKNTSINKKQAQTENNIDKVSVLTKTIIETKSTTEKASTTKLVPEVPVNNNQSTNVSSVKQAVENINLKTIQAKTSQVQSQPVGINLEKPTQDNQMDAKTTASVNISNSSNTKVKELTHTVHNIPESQSVQKSNVAEVQVSTDQTKDRSISTFNKGTSQGLEQILSHDNSQTLITEQTSVAAKNSTISNMPSQNPSNDVSADIGKQILESVQRSVSQQGVDQQITVRLNPPELGKVFIKFQQQDSELTGLMEVSKTQTRVEIEQTLPQIIRNLADSGIQVKRIEVMLSNEEQSGQGTSGNQSLQSGGSQQQYSGNPGTSENDMDVDRNNELLTSNNSYDGLSELEEALITDSSINMLI